MACYEWLTRLGLVSNRLVIVNGKASPSLPANLPIFLNLSDCKYVSIFSKNDTYSSAVFPILQQQVVVVYVKVPVHYIDC